jgi:hypothetical protein
VLKKHGPIEATARSVHDVTDTESTVLKKHGPIEAQATVND